MNQRAVFLRNQQNRLFTSLTNQKRREKTRNNRIRNQKEIK